MNGETIQPDAVYYDHYLDEEDYDSTYFMDEEDEPSKVVRLRGGTYIEI